MSVLTDIFTSLSNKIRSRLGTSNTYTPVEAISAIDDVYNKGVIDTKIGNAGAGDVLSGKTFTNSSTVGEIGTMTNNGAVSQSLNCGGSYTIPAGYHNGSGTVTANSLASQTGVDSGKTAVTAGTMVSGYQGWVNGSKISGTFTGQEKTVTAGTSAASVTPDSGKYLTKVTYNPTPSQSKSASPSTSAQTISPDSGKLLSSVSISAISPQRSAGTAAVASGKDSTGPYVYFPYGWYPSGGNDRQYVRMTAAQAVAACPSQEKTVTSSRSAQTVSPDSGKLLSKVTVNALAPTGTYTASSRGASLDMGATSNYRYVNTNSVPNTNSGTFTPTSNSSAHDMGATNTYRYVNTNTVYNAGVNATKNTNFSNSNVRWKTTNYGIEASYCTGYGYVNSTDGIYGHVNFPEGFYTDDLHSWAPEVHMTMAQVQDFANQCDVGQLSMYKASDKCHWFGVYLSDGDSLYFNFNHLGISPNGMYVKTNGTDLWNQNFHIYSINSNGNQVNHCHPYANGWRGGNWYQFGFSSGHTYICVRFSATGTLSMELYFYFY